MQKLLPFKDAETVLALAMKIVKNSLRHDCHLLIPFLHVVYVPTGEIVTAEQVLGPKGENPNTILARLKEDRVPKWIPLEKFAPLPENLQLFY